jgi:hypothetical protein
MTVADPHDFAPDPTSSKRLDPDLVTHIAVLDVSQLKTDVPARWRKTSHLDLAALPGLWIQTIFLFGSDFPVILCADPT